VVFDCGLAIFTCLLLFIVCWDWVMYKQADFRPHFIPCLKQKEISEFPHDVMMKNPGKSLLH